MPIKHLPNLLSIAGSDPSGGAGIQADLKTFTALSAYGMAVITTITVQNTWGIQALYPLPAFQVRAQLEAILEDIPVDAIKIGMLATPDIVKTVAHVLTTHAPNVPLVLDPVLAPSLGMTLAPADLAAAICTFLKGRVSVLTPNALEAARLVQQNILPQNWEEAVACARKLHAQGLGQAILLKGGHMPQEDPTSIMDCLWQEESAYPIKGPHIETYHTHGTGCTLSSALAVYLAQGYDMKEAVTRARLYLTQALRQGEQLKVGGNEKGRHGPVGVGLSRCD